MWLAPIALVLLQAGQVEVPEPSSSPSVAPGEGEEGSDGSEVPADEDAQEGGSDADPAPSEAETSAPSEPPESEVAAQPPVEPEGSAEATPESPSADPEAGTPPEAAPPAGPPAIKVGCPELETPEATVEACAAYLAKKQKEVDERKAEEEKKRKEGFWTDKHLHVGASALGLFNRSFVGQTDGLTIQFGAFAGGDVTLGYSGHEWRSAFAITESMIAQPSVEQLIPFFIKAADEASASTEYKFRWGTVPWVGPFAKAEARTQVFPGYVLKDTPVSVIRSNLDGTTEIDSFAAGTPIFLTSWFEPLTLTETAGVFVEPPDVKPWITYGFKAAAAANHVVALGGYVNADNPDTPELELNQIGIVNSAGVQGEARVSGAVLEYMTWGLNAVVYYPILAVGANVEDVGLLERTHLDVDALVSVKVLKWASIDGVVKVRRQPFVLNDWQVQASLLFTAGFNIL